MNTDQATLTRVAARCSDACRRLGVKIITPYTFESGRETVTILAFFPDFGGPNGTFLAQTNAPEYVTDRRVIRKAEQEKRFLSFIDASGWANCDDSAFLDSLLDALEDWDYFGDPSGRPEWLGRRD